VQRFMKIATVATLATLGLAACGSGDDDSTAGTGSSGSASSSSGASSTIKVGMAYDVGGRGDKSFNDAAALGLDKAKTELGVQTKELEAKQGESDSDKEERLRLLATGGYNPIIGVGFAYAGALEKVAKDYPKIDFAIVDDASFTLDNVANLTFAEEQGSYLVGAAAALASKTGSVGFIGGVNEPLLQKFQAGFDAGAKQVNPNIKLQDKYLTEPPDFTGFSDPAKGKTTAQGMFDAGADVVFAAAGGSGSGAFDAAVASGKLAIGTDSDQYLTATAAQKPVILTSMIKRVDVAVYDEIKSATDGKTLTGPHVYDLKVDGVGYSTSNPLIAPYQAQIDALKAKIISGEITVPTTP
jgi:basic membrane protein A